MGSPPRPGYGLSRLQGKRNGFLRRHRLPCGSGRAEHRLVEIEADPCQLAFHIGLLDGRTRVFYRFSHDIRPGVELGGDLSIANIRRILITFGRPQARQSFEAVDHTNLVLCLLETLLTFSKNIKGTREIPFPQVDITDLDDTPQ